MTITNTAAPQTWPLHGTIDGEHLTLDAAAYAYHSTNRACIMLFNDEGELYDDLTINSDTIELNDDYIIINPNLHSDVLHLALSTGLLKSGVISTHHLGHHTVAVYQLSTQAHTWVATQLSQA